MDGGVPTNLDRCDPHVLVVEDDADVLESLALILTDHGYRVLTATSGADALRVLESRERPALILLDLIMPGMDGLTLLDRLRGDHRFAHVPITILSAGSIGRAPRGYPFLRKPVSVEDLLAVVAKHCRRTIARGGS
jgi:CheY-like chemotaxis protein